MNGRGGGSGAIIAAMNEHNPDNDAPGAPADDHGTTHFGFRDVPTGE